MIGRVINILLCAFFLSFCVCKTIWINTSKENDSIGATTVDQLQITSADVGGWQLSDYNIYSATGLRGPLDGGADQYISSGLIEAAIQNLTGSSGKILQAYCMDFGNEENSITMDLVMKHNISGSPLPIPYFPDTVAQAQGASAAGVIAVYAHFKKFFIQLAITGCQNQIEALQTASLFLLIYQSKIE
jgi:hypothetical protein